MEKQKKWQVWLIIAVMTLTLYNILPTVFYYSKPLKNLLAKKRLWRLRKALLNV